MTSISWKSKSLPHFVLILTCRLCSDQSDARSINRETTLWSLTLPKKTSLSCSFHMKKLSNHFAISDVTFFRLELFVNKPQLETATSKPPRKIESLKFAYYTNSSHAQLFLALVIDWRSGHGRISAVANSSLIVHFLCYVHSWIHCVEDGRNYHTRLPYERILYLIGASIAFKFCETDLR